MLDWIVVIPHYQQQGYLQEAVRSALNQRNVQLEVIVVDDASPDGLPDLPEDPRLTIIRQPENGERSRARNTGIRSRESRFVACLDADDIWFQDYLRTCQDILESRSEVSVVYPDAVLFGQTTGRWETPDTVSFQSLLETNRIPYCSAYRREVFEGVGGYRENIHCLEDWCFWLDAWKRYPAIQAVKIPGDYFFYRQHRQSTMARFSYAAAATVVRRYHPIPYHLGWFLSDGTQGYGGAELNTAALIQAAPPGFSCHSIYPGQPIPTMVDGYIIPHLTYFSEDIIPFLEKAPTVLVMHDIQAHGSFRLRQWVAENAVGCVMVSPAMHDWIDFRITVPVRYIPSPVSPPVGNISNNLREHRACWIGRIEQEKGVDRAIDYARQHGLGLDIYGYGGYEPILRQRLEQGETGFCLCGRLSYNEVFSTLKRYEVFIHLPAEHDACPRSVIEAYFAGVPTIVANGNSGASYWIRNCPELLHTATRDFWDYIRKTLEKT
jgi:glycosyltransferase involved in cell wall biosynthesis